MWSGNHSAAGHGYRCAPALDAGCLCTGSVVVEFFENGAINQGAIIEILLVEIVIIRVSFSELSRDGLPPPSGHTIDADWESHN